MNRVLACRILALLTTLVMVTGAGVFSSRDYDADSDATSASQTNRHYARVHRELERDEPSQGVGEPGTGSNYYDGDTQGEGVVQEDDDDDYDQAKDRVVRRADEGEYDGGEQRGEVNTDDLEDDPADPVEEDEDAVMSAGGVPLIEVNRDAGFVVDPAYKRSLAVAMHGHDDVRFNLGMKVHCVFPYMIKGKAASTCKRIAEVSYE